MADGSGAHRRYLAPVTSALKRARSLDPQVVDRLLAAGLVLLSIVESVAFGEGGTDAALGAAIGTAGLISLLLRRTAPLVTLLVVPVTTAIAAILAPFYLNEMAAPFLALMATLYSVGRYEVSRRGTVLAAVTLVVVAIATGLFLLDDNAAQLLWLFVLGGGPFVAGRVFANRARLVRELRDRTAELERDRAAQAERAVEDERARIAAELQAAVANGVSAMVVQAEAVPRVLAEGDRASAAEAFVLIEETGRDSLGEMRRLLGVLRRDADELELAPQPTMDEVERLAESARADGLDVSLEFEGERVGLGAGTDLAAYRVLQEALRAAVAGGARSAAILVTFGDGELVLEVRDDRGPTSVDPEPLMAMRERLGLYGGRVRAEALREGGFQVVARMPREAVPA